MHEEFLAGTAAELLAELEARPSVRGEFTVAIPKCEAAVDEGAPLEEEVAALMKGGVPRMDALKQVARRRGLSKREVYKALQE